MNYYRVFGLVAITIGPAVFVYLISSFLVATFDINLWYKEQRFFAVLAYLVLVVNLLSASRSNVKSSPGENKDQNPVMLKTHQEASETL